MIAIWPREIPRPRSKREARDGILSCFAAGPNAPLDDGIIIIMMIIVIDIKSCRIWQGK